MITYKYDVTWEYAVPYYHLHNAKAERSNQTITELLFPTNQKQSTTYLLKIRFYRIGLSDSGLESDYPILGNGLSDSSIRFWKAENGTSILTSMQCH